MQLYAYLVRYDEHISYEVGLNYAVLLLKKNFGISEYGEYLNIFILNLTP